MTRLTTLQYISDTWVSKLSPVSLNKFKVVLVLVISLQVICYIILIVMCLAFHDALINFFDGEMC